MLRLDSDISGTNRIQTIRAAGGNDLAAINRIVESALMTWDLPERVKRLSLPSYLYHEVDLQHLGIVVAEGNGELTGVAAWEPAEKQDCPADAQGLLLYGLYVAPAKKAQGIGRQLLRRAEMAAIDGGFDGVLVKAQADAVGFYEKTGFTELPVEDSARNFDKRYWKPVALPFKS